MRRLQTLCLTLGLVTGCFDFPLEHAQLSDGGTSVVDSSSRDAFPQDLGDGPLDTRDVPSDGSLTNDGQVDVLPGDGSARDQGQRPDMAITQINGCETCKCGPGEHCTFSCTADNPCANEIDCGGAASCVIECSGGAACNNKINCGAGPCRVRCVGEEACNGGVACNDSCSCSVSCEAEDACENNTEGCPDGCRDGNNCRGDLMCNRCS